jgi:hypothetical protein
MNKNYEFCRICQNRKFNRNSGLYCGLTSKKPDFTFECPEYKLDENAANLGKVMPGATAQSKNPIKTSKRLIALGGALGFTGFVFKYLEILDSGIYGRNYDAWFRDLAIVSTYVMYLGILLFASAISYLIYLKISTDDNVNSEVIDQDLEDELDLL